jgi:hypothetical protein
MMVMKPKGRLIRLFVHAGLYIGSRGFQKRPYGKPEEPNRYGSKFIRYIELLASAPTPPKPPKTHYAESYSAESRADSDSEGSRGGGARADSSTLFSEGGGSKVKAVRVAHGSTSAWLRWGAVKMRESPRQMRKLFRPP